MTENKMCNPIYAEGFYEGLKVRPRTMTKDAFQDIIDFMKYKHCNCLNKCEDCPTDTCYIQMSLVSILRELECERDRFYGKDEHEA
jgi:hypothetical protein